MAGLFALDVELLGGLISCATTRIDRRWGRAERHIAQLCDQVAAYWQLEQLYKDALARLGPAGPSAKTIMGDMRSRVAQSGEFERPSLTALAASLLRVRNASIVLALPALAYAVYIALDAATLLRSMGSENSMIGLAFFGLMILSCVLLHLVLRGRSVAG